MQRKELNRATIELANNRDMSGRETADEINRGLRTAKERSFRRIVCSIFLSCLTLAGLLLAVAPLPVRADNDEESRHGREDNDRRLRAEIKALQATVSALQDQVNTLQSQLAAVQSNPALALGPFVSVDPKPEIGVIGPNITFSGANIHIVSGSGSTDDGMSVNPNATLTGLGNLIIGYNEVPDGLSLGDRGGAHNLVIGSFNKFTQFAFGGLVAGEINTISAESASVLGGLNNTASGPGASVSGGLNNTAFGANASVLGGSANSAGGNNDSVLGGLNNAAFGDNASVTGGSANTAGGANASVLGGFGNVAGGFQTVVIGGQNVTDNKDNSIAPHPPFP
jgi:cell division protein FtsB